MINRTWTTKPRYCSHLFLYCVATVVTIVGPSLAELVKATLKPTQKLKSVLITSINGILVTGNNRLSFTRRHLTARGLGEDLDIEYEIALEELCSTQTCDNAQEISNALYASVTEEMRTEINSGKFATVLKETAAEQDVIVEVAVGESNFEELVVVVLALASPATWYPVWTNGNYCSNDGEQRELVSFLAVVFLDSVCLESSYRFICSHPASERQLFT